MSIHNDLLLVSQSIIQGIGLQYTPSGGGPTALPTGQAYARKVLTDRDTLLPCLVISLGGKEQLERGDMEDTEVVYPVLVAHLFASNRSYAINDDELTWRQLIIDAFIDQPRPEVTSAQVSDCQIETDPPIDLSLFQNKMLDVGGLLLQFRTLRARPPR